jgi:cell wall-associated NlpC family hydrolase
LGDGRKRPTFKEVIRAVAQRISRRTAAVAAALALLALLAAALGSTGAGSDSAGSDRAGSDSAGSDTAGSDGASGDEIVLGGYGSDAGPTEAERRAAERTEKRGRAGRGRAVRFAGVSGDGVWVDPAAAKRPPPKPPSDAEVREELRQFRRYLASTGGLEGPRARVLPDGRAVAPRNAPDVVKQVIQAANAIADTPYKWGGGHGGWEDTGYDCSGSVSFALAGAGLLQSPLNSTGFMSWGSAGEGRWITVYTNPGHAFMVVAGLRFDTSGRAANGTRWQTAGRSVAGFEARHFPGL